MNLKGTGSVRATLLAKLWLTTTCWQSKLTSALGFSGASWEGMQSCIDFTAGFSQTILFEPGWHWECCCPTSNHEAVWSSPSLPSQDRAKEASCTKLLPLSFQETSVQWSSAYWSICIAFVLRVIISTYTFGARINWVTFRLLCSAMYVQCTG